MDLKRKLEILQQAIDSIATHADEDADVRRAALTKGSGMLKSAADRIDAEVAEQIAAI